MSTKNKKPCGECARRETFEALEEAKNHLPQEFEGWGAKHEGYVMGLVHTIEMAIEAVSEELEQWERDGYREGDFYPEDEDDE